MYQFFLNLAVFGIDVLIEMIVSEFKYIYQQYTKNILNILQFIMHFFILA